MSDHSVDAMGYAEALAELESILRELETTAVDVDVLAQKVARARALAAHCRQRIEAARIHVEAVVADEGMA